MEKELIASNAASWTQKHMRVGALLEEIEDLRRRNAVLSEQNGLLKASLSASNATRLQAFDALARLQTGAEG